MWSSGSSSRASSSQGSAPSSSRNTPQPPPPPPPPPPPQPLDDANMRNVTGRVIHSGRAIQLPENEYGILNTQLIRFGWEYIPILFSDYFSTPLVYEFYGRANFYFENGEISRPALVTSVAGQPILLNRLYLSILLGIPDDGEIIFFKKKYEDFKNALNGVDENIFYNSFLKNNYRGGRIYEKHLQNDFRNLNAFLEANILPKACTNNSISKYQGFIIYCNSIQRKLNLSYIILSYMRDIIQNETLGLGYGSMLTHFFTTLGIPVQNYYSTRSMLPISQRTINLRNSHPFHVPPQDAGQNQGEQADQPQDPHQQFGEMQQYQPPPPHNDDAYAQFGPDLYYDINNP